MGGVFEVVLSVLSVRTCIGCVVGKSSMASSVVSPDVTGSLEVSSQAGKSIVSVGGVSDERCTVAKVDGVVV